MMDRVSWPAVYLLLGILSVFAAVVAFSPERGLPNIGGGVVLGLAGLVCIRASVGAVSAAARAEDRERYERALKAAQQGHIR